MGDGQKSDRGSYRGTVSAFCVSVFVLLAGLGLKLWSNRQLVVTQKAQEKRAATQDAASVAFYHQVQHLIGPNVTRAQLESRLPDAKPIAAATWTDKQDGSVFDEITYRNPATDGRVVVSYLKQQWRSLGPARADPIVLSETFGWYLGERLWQLIHDTAGWAWGCVLIYYLLASKPRQRVGRALALLTCAIAFAASVLTRLGRGGEWSRIVWTGDFQFAMLILLVSALIVQYAWLHRFTHDPLICAECGYDLRATPDRCPECGTVAARRD